MSERLEISSNSTLGLTEKLRLGAAVGPTVVVELAADEARALAAILSDRSEEFDARRSVEDATLRYFQSCERFARRRDEFLDTLSGMWVEMADQAARADAAERLVARFGYAAVCAIWSGICFGMALRVVLSSAGLS